MRITIIEFLVHGETIDSLCQMLEKSSAEVTFLVSQKIYNELKEQPYLNQFNWIIKPEELIISEFLKTQQSFLDTQDFILFNTVQRFFTEYFQFQFKATTILRVHNLNFMFKPLKIGGLFRPQSFDSLKYKVKRLVVERDWYHVAQMLRWVDYVSFPSDALENHALRHSMLPSEKICPVIPLACSKRIMPSIPSSSSPFIITIPGEVSLERKDYQTVLDAFKILIPNLTEKVKLVFLGKQNDGTKERAIIEELVSLTNDYFEFQYFEERVSQQVFNETMESTHLLLSPIQQDFYTPSSIEYYGKTKISGSISDIIKHNKLAILPDFYPLNDVLAQVVKLYKDTNDLANLLKNIVVNPPSTNATYLTNLHQAYHPDKLGEGIINTLNSLK